MDGDFKSSILKGCKLARELESRLQSLMTQPKAIASSCEEIARVFHGAGERLILATSSSSEGCARVQSSGRLATRSNSTVRYPEADQVGGRMINPGGSATILHGMERGGVNVRASTVSASPDSSRGSAFSSHGTSRRRDRAGRVIRVAVPEIGNPELPPDDGHTWRKYGQKKILDSKFPRGYYRCTHKNLYNCPAKRMVQRLDPSTIEVTYKNDHICHLSPTAPLLVPPPPPNLSALANHNGRLMTAAPPPLSLEPSIQGGVACGGEGTAPRGTASGDRDNAEYAVVQMADAMFNSQGNGSTNGIMDLIFTTNCGDNNKRHSSGDQHQ